MGDLALKIGHFNHAMARYNTHSIYSHCKFCISILILTLQAYTLYNLLNAYDNTSYLIIVLAFASAYCLTDLINGLIHMFMDNNTNYNSLVGPFVASFHLHHAKRRYEYKSAIKVYFYESGTKFWLAAYLIVLALYQKLSTIPYGIHVGLVAIGILSSVAEVSHYWCHNATEKNLIIYNLQKARVLLSKKHHMHHHQSDNMHYAFLNGISDPLINLIARYCYAGYKNNADKHTAAYIRSIGSISIDPQGHPLEKL